MIRVGRESTPFFELDGLVSYHAGGIVDGHSTITRTSIRIRRDIDSDYGISLVDGGGPAGRRHI